MSLDAGTNPKYDHGVDQDDEKTFDRVTIEVEQQAPIVEQQTIRALKGRQMSMIAFGGAVGECPSRLRASRTVLITGTGLIIGSGTSLARSGPGSLFLAYVAMGVT